MRNEQLLVDLGVDERIARRPDERCSQLTVFSRGHVIISCDAPRALLFSSVTRTLLSIIRLGTPFVLDSVPRVLLISTLQLTRVTQLYN